MEEITADQSELKRTRDAKQVDGGGKEVKKTSLDRGKRNATPTEFFLPLVYSCVYIYKNIMETTTVEVDTTAE